MPFYWLGGGRTPHRWQVLSLAAGGVAVYLIGRDLTAVLGRRCPRRRPPLHPSYQYRRVDIPSEALALAPLLFAYCWPGLSARACCVMAMIALSFKEEMALAIAVLG